MGALFAWVKDRCGPALIVAAVVLGPGSILTSSKVGCQYGYGMLWVVAMAGLLMVGATALSSRLGASLDGSLCDELAANVGRPVSVLIGLTLFLVVASFQASNNLAVIAALEPFFPEGETPSNWISLTKACLLVAANGLVVATLYGLKQIYQSLEKLMITLVALMVIGFGINLAFAQPSLLGMLQGLLPTWPAGEGFWPYKVDDQVKDSYWAVQGMIATTFSIAGAFYQAYLVREKGWSRQDLKKGLGDSITGIAALGLTTMMIMSTSAAVLYGRVEPDSLKSATDVAAQLEPLFGQFAALLFVLGIFAGAFSSFLVNASIGGVLLSDGLGLGAKLDQAWPKRFTVLALACGMGVAIATLLTDVDLVGLIIFAQALTVLGGPVLAISLLYLAVGKTFRERVQAPMWMIGLMSLGLIVVTLLAMRTGVKVWLSVS
ncbi:NRAMP family divalent metal transporter [Rubinisphaera brasiliensis]|uniref:Cytochrome ba3-putative manganese transport protein MntH n=1 Tax=Rubinisphaera brasiliensis (strain ATCC 49424 / DSM 5305 / JCM 21570 / IAM 15109 / NBRC 103401 / IFAM 1448) TaxID=756272 RepID=F0SGT5_RUBBR|nr:divalent metal cation transporter [Rubinisphaera brasiliensis]ADY58370.1 cytochrome ba3-putative manganese transport protein MntH [Rubinisphaera brasiliensis DSM 5305]